MGNMPHVENVEIVKKSDARDASFPGFGLLFASIVTLSFGIFFLLARFFLKRISQICSPSPWSQSGPMALCNG